MIKELMQKKKIHPLFETLFSLRGTPAASIYTEPLWGIPFYLFVTYASLYMLALGLSEKQIGLVVSFGLVCQVFFTLISGAVTDKLGRRMTTFIFDMISWGLCTLIWAVAQNIYFFLAAAFFNSIFKITQNSWTLLLTEDAPKDKLVHIFTWIQIALLLSGFVAPLAGILVDKMTLIPAVRVIYAFASVSMITKFIILFVYSKETERGKIRMEETKGVPIYKLVGQLRGSFLKLIKTPQTVKAFFILLSIALYTILKDTFWSIQVFKNLGFAESSIALFPFIKSVTMLSVFLLATPFFLWEPIQASPDNGLFGSGPGQCSSDPLPCTELCHSYQQYHS
jgi:MFS family permease